MDFTYKRRENIPTNSMNKKNEKRSKSIARDRLCVYPYQEINVRHDKVKEEIESEENFKKSSIYSKLQSEYVLEEDIIPISKITKEKNFAVSFRSAGKFTLEKLKQGAGAKAHNLLEKTLKPKAVTKDEIQEARKKYGETIDEEILIDKIKRKMSIDVN